MWDYWIVGLIGMFLVKENVRTAYKFSIIIGIILIVHLVGYTIVVESIIISHEPFNGFRPETDVVMLRYLLLGASIVELFFTYACFLTLKKEVKAQEEKNKIETMETPRGKLYLNIE